jgi:Acyl carrier protein phosphodiesterase
METLLKIQASLFGAQGQSTQLADRFIEHWHVDHPQGRVIVRDLNANPVPHLTLEDIQAFGANPADRTPAQQAIVNASDALIAELKAADIIVFAVPMYNFSVPSTLRAYFDHIARKGVTFRYTEPRSGRTAQGQEDVCLHLARRHLSRKRGHADPIPQAVPRLHRA